MNEALSDASGIFNLGLKVQAYALSIASITQIGRDHAGALGPIVQVALSSTLGQTVKPDETASAAQLLLVSAPSVFASIIAAGTEGRYSAADFLLPILIQLLGTICRLTLEAHPPLTILTAIMMPSLAAGIIGNPSINRPPAAAVN